MREKYFLLQFSDQYKNQEASKKADDYHLFA